MYREDEDGGHPHMRLNMLQRRLATSIPPRASSPGFLQKKKAKKAPSYVTDAEHLAPWGLQV